MTKFQCVRCKGAYESDEDDAYYCPPCLEAKNQLAVDLDKKKGSQPIVHVKSDLEIYDSMPKVRGAFPNYRNFMH